MLQNRTWLSVRTQTVVKLGCHDVLYIYIYIYINTGVSEKSATSIFIVNWLQNVGMMSNRHTGLHLPMCTASEFRCNNGER